MATRRQGDSKLAVAYLRVSTDRQDNGPEVQRAAIEKWATARGVQVVAWFQEVVSGAAAIEDRPALLDALAALPVTSAGILVVQKRDRLARDVLNSALIKRMVANAGGEIISTAGEGEGTGPEARLLSTIMDALAEWERATIAARTRAALQHMKARGERVGSVPLGKRLENGRLVQDYAETKGIELAHHLHGTGMSLAAVGRELTASGFNCRSGRPYQAVQVKRMLGLP